MSIKESTKKDIKSISLAVLIALAIRIMIFEPYSIPSGSMKPNFLVGDYLFVSKYHYGISNVSFPFSPELFEGRKIVINKPKRGEVIVFKSDNSSINYIKRLVGLPGDKIQVRNGLLYINGEAVKLEKDGAFTDTDGHKLTRYIETLPNGTSYPILDDTPYGHLDNTELYEVPEGHYFLMGDNRDHSSDSRTNGYPIGYVPYSSLIGRAEIIIFSNPYSMFELWNWPFAFNKNRFFEKVTN